MLTLSNKLHSFQLLVGEFLIDMKPKLMSAYQAISVWCVETFAHSKIYFQVLLEN